MSNLLGSEVFKKLQSENVFQSSDSELIKKIAIDMINSPDDWNGLGFLNSPYPQNWHRFLYKIIKIVPAGWNAKHGVFVEFVKILRNNWLKPIPELLAQLDKYEIGVDDFFKLERKVTFKFASLVSDINILQKEILKEKSYDISRFMSWYSHAFLPSTVFQLEEFGLPRMISKKIQNAGLYDFIRQGTDIHKVLADLNEIGIERILQIPTLLEFDKYIIDYFYDGIKTNNNIIQHR